MCAGRIPPDILEIHIGEVRCDPGDGVRSVTAAAGHQVRRLEGDAEIGPVDCADKIERLIDRFAQRAPMGLLCQREAAFCRDIRGMPGGRNIVWRL